jgi:hypothetical protein
MSIHTVASNHIKLKERHTETHRAQFAPYFDLWSKPSRQTHKDTGIGLTVKNKLNTNQYNLREQWRICGDIKSRPTVLISFIL